MGGCWAFDACRCGAVVPADGGANLTGGNPAGKVAVHRHRFRSAPEATDGKTGKGSAAAFACGQICDKATLEAVLQQPAKTKPAPVSMPEEIQNSLQRLNQKTISDFERAVARGEWENMEVQLGRAAMLQLVQYAMQCQHPEAATG